MIDFTIKPDDGEEYLLTAGTRDLLAWERTSKGKSFAKLLDDMNMVDLYRVAYLAAKRQNRFDGSQADFEELCEIDFEEAEEPDPTKLDPSTGG